MSKNLISLVCPVCGKAENAHYISQDIKKSFEYIKKLYKNPDYTVKYTDYITSIYDMHRDYISVEFEGGRAGFKYKNQLSPEADPDGFIELKYALFRALHWLLNMKWLDEDEILDGVMTGKVIGIDGNVAVRSFSEKQGIAELALQEYNETAKNTKEALAKNKADREQRLEDEEKKREELLGIKKQESQKDIKALESINASYMDIVDESYDILSNERIGNTPLLDATHKDTWSMEEDDDNVVQDMQLVDKMIDGIKYELSKYKEETADIVARHLAGTDTYDRMRGLINRLTMIRKAFGTRRKLIASSRTENRKYNKNTIDKLKRDIENRWYRMEKDDNRIYMKAIRHLDTNEEDMQSLWGHVFASMVEEIRSYSDLGYSNRSAKLKQWIDNAGLKISSLIKIDKDGKRIKSSTPEDNIKANAILTMQEIVIRYLHSTEVSMREAESNHTYYDPQPIDFASILDFASMVNSNTKNSIEELEEEVKVKVLASISRYLSSSRGLRQTKEISRSREIEYSKPGNHISIYALGKRAPEAKKLAERELNSLTKQRTETILNSMISKMLKYNNLNDDLLRFLRAIKAMQNTGVYNKSTEHRSNMDKKTIVDYILKLAVVERELSKDKKDTVEVAVPAVTSKKNVVKEIKSREEHQILDIPEDIQRIIDRLKEDGDDAAIDAINEQLKKGDIEIVRILAEAFLRASHPDDDIVE